MPKQDDLLVFISTRGKRAGRAAAIASNLGYSGYATFSVDFSGSSATFTVLPMCSALEFWTNVKVFCFLKFHVQIFVCIS